MHLEVFVEEESAQITLTNLIPRIAGPAVTFRFHAYSGKQALLRKLPQRLVGYRSWPLTDWHVVVLVDRDRADCHSLKTQLEKAAADAGLTTRTNARPDGTFQVMNRIAVNELEAWLIGDPDAVSAAYPRVRPEFARRKGYRDPDATGHGAAEALRLLLRRAGYYGGQDYLPKVEVARAISAHLNPDRNGSRSFRAFRDGLVNLTTAACDDCN